jgi:DNA invertase Pin-like site-specific DNA recombinase
MQNKGRFVAYYRVSTEKQGIRSDAEADPKIEAITKVRGLGIDAQKEAVARYLERVNGEQVGKGFEEVESGKRNDRPELAKALATCKTYGATLIIAKLDRLARNVHFISGLMESKVEFVAVDFPQANRLTIHILAAVAEHEAGMISARTKAALAVLKARGVKLGTHQPERIIPHAKKGGLASGKVRRERARQRALDLLPVIDEVRSTGATTLAAIAEELNRKGITALRGGRWASRQVLDVLHYATAAEAMKEAA